MAESLIPTIFIFNKKKKKNIKFDMSDLLAISMSVRFTHRITYIWTFLSLIVYE